MKNVSDRCMHCPEAELTFSYQSEKLLSLLIFEQRLVTFFVSYIEAHHANNNELTGELKNLLRALQIAYEPVQKVAELAGQVDE